MSTYFWTTNVYIYIYICRLSFALLHTRTSVSVTVTFTRVHVFFFFFYVYMYIPRYIYHVYIDTYIYRYIYINGVEPRSRSPSSPRNYAISRSRLVGFDCSLDVSTELDNLAERRNDSCICATTPISRTDFATDKQPTPICRSRLERFIRSLQRERARWKWRRGVTLTWSDPRFRVADEDKFASSNRV